jgi:hypothetical protein
MECVGDGISDQVCIAGGRLNVANIRQNSHLHCAVKMPAILRNPDLASDET